MHSSYGKSISYQENITNILTGLYDAVEHISAEGILDEPHLSVIFKHFPHLENLKNTYDTYGTDGFNKYRHTLKLARNFYILKTTPDITALNREDKEITYNNFYRPDKRTANAFSLENFEELCRRYKEIITTAEEEYFFLYWLFAHDYGTTAEHAELNVPHHTTWSSFIAHNEIIEQRNPLFDQLHLDITDLMLDSHSCFGDLFLGEASFFNYEILQQKFSKICRENSNLSSAPITWQQALGYLVLLNIIDVNSGNSGSNLYSDHFQNYMDILDNKYFQKTPEEERLARLNEIFTHNGTPLDISQTGLEYEDFIARLNAEITADLALKNNFRELYLQYFYGIFNGLTENHLLQADAENPGHILIERLLKQLCALWGQVRTKTDNTDRLWFDYIVFENDKFNEEVNKLLAERCQQYSPENCVDLENQTFLGIKYSLPDPHIFDDRFLAVKTAEALGRS